MDNEFQLKVQAYLDGELAEAEAREVANLLARDQEASLLLKELRQTRQAMAGAEDGVRLPESREFYWSKIRRQIEAQEVSQLPPVRIPWWRQLGRVLVPASAVALVVVAGFVATRGLTSPGRAASEMALADPETLTYRDYAAGATLIWVTYPAEKEVAQLTPASTFE